MNSTNRQIKTDDQHGKSLAGLSELRPENLSTGSERETGSSSERNEPARATTPATDSKKE